MRRTPLCKRESRREIVRKKGGRERDEREGEIERDPRENGKRKRLWDVDREREGRRS